MLATLGEASLDDPQLLYELKYDGIRALAEIVPAGRQCRVQLFSRLGNDKSGQFPDLVDALSSFGARLTDPIILDGEIVALDPLGRPAGFQRLQGRMHLTAVSRAAVAAQPVAFVAFDILCQDGGDVCELPLIERRARLERLFRRKRPLVRLSELARGHGRRLLAQATRHGWEGLIVKRATSRYRPGKRTSDWRKLKLVQQREFVVGGWTEPRASRSHFGALLLGYYDRGALVYAGRAGSGFDEQELTRLWTRLRPLATKTCPFAVTPRPDERPHWIEPRLVAAVKFSEWTDGGMLRHPIYMGLRDDVVPKQVRREPSTKTRRKPVEDLSDALQRLEDDRGEGVITLAGEVRLSVTNLGKVFWPKGRITKGELLRYYVRVAPYLLPVVEDRPLVMERFPNGIDGKVFYQQRAPDTVSEGVRVEMVEGDTDVPARLVGGSLVTLLHMAQLAVISQDPWFSRVQSPHTPDHVAIDLDPGDGVPFARVLEVARWVRDELEALGVRSVPKTSGADGLHIYIPLGPGIPYQTGMIFCQIVATVVSEKHPGAATVERSVRSRGRTVYLDCLQNIEGKTLACAYSARASDYAGASTPLRWEEIDAGLDRRDFTIRTLPARLEEVGDLWARLRRAKGANLRAVEKYLKK